MGTVISTFRALQIRAAFIALITIFASTTALADCYELLTQARLGDSQFDSWQTLREPFEGTRPRGLAALRRAIDEGGLVIVIEGARPKQAWRVEALEFMYGAKLVFTADFPAGAGLVRGPGVALHPDNTPLLASVYRGELNPHLGYGRLHGSLNKWLEYVLAESISPNVMPRTVRAIDLKDALPTPESAREMLERLDQGKASSQDIRNWTSVVARFLEATAQAFPEGAFIKHVGEYATKDKNGQLMSWKADAAEIVRRGFKRIAAIRARQADKALADAEVQEAINTARGAEARFMNALLRDPASVLVQSRLDIALTELGFPLEFRVDFVDGEAVRALPRHSEEFMPEEAATAMRFLNEFFAKAPEKYRYLAGGADVMFLKNGEMRFIEFNFGAQSEFIDAGAGYPVIPNEYVAALTGRKTPLLSQLEAMSKRPIEELAEYLKRLDQLLGKGKWGDFSAVSYESFRYVRDLKLREWARNPTREGARKLTRDLRKLAKLAFQGVTETEATLLQMQPFLNRSLK